MSEHDNTGIGFVHTVIDEIATVFTKEQLTETYNYAIDSYSFLQQRRAYLRDRIREATSFIEYLKRDMRIAYEASTPDTEDGQHNFMWYNELRKYTKQTKKEIAQLVDLQLQTKGQMKNLSYAIKTYGKLIKE